MRGSGAPARASGIPRSRAAGHAAALVVEEERRLRPRAGQAELTGIARQAPRRPILSRGPQWLGDIGFGQPFNLRVIVLQHIIDLVRPYQFGGARAVFANRAEQGKCVARRYMKPLSPAGQDGFVVRKQPPSPGLDPDVLMLSDDERHREGERISRVHGPPAVVVDGEAPTTPITRMVSRSAITTEIPVIFDPDGRRSRRH